MRKEKKPTLDAKSWAVATKANGGGNPCRLCVAAPAVGKDIETVARMREAGETMVSYRQLSEFLLEKHGFEVKQTALLKHIRDHLRIKWAR